FSVNLNQKLLQDRLNLNFNYKGGFTRNQFDPGLVGSARTLDPTQPVLDPSNDAFAGFFEYGVALAPRNPISAAEQLDRSGRTYRNIGNFEIDYQFLDQIPGLSFKLNLGFDANNGGFRGFEPTTYTNTQAGAQRNGFVIIENFNRESKLLDAFLSYDRSFGKHSLNATAGYSYQNFTSEFPKTEASGFTRDALGFDNVRGAEQVISFRPRTENRLISFVGRAIYSFDNRYILSGSIRRDGSSRFGPENRWGWFPAVSASWKILEEDFAQGLANIFSTLGLRVGFGIVGNQEIGEDGYRPLYQLSDGMTSYQFGDEFVETVRPDAYDPALKWEETRSINVGLDFGFANGRFSGSVEYFNERTDDLLFQAPIPAGTNLSDRVLTNIGALNNAGVELNLTGVVVNTNNFDWRLNGNVSFLQNEVRAINSISSTGIQTGSIEGGVGNNVQILQVGQPSFSFFLFEHILDENGNPLADGIDHNENGVTENDLADIYVDINGDGQVDDMDRRPIGNPAPDVLFGITSQMNYKGLDFGFTIRGSIGNEVYNNNASNRGNYRFLTVSDQYLNNLHTSVLLTNFDAPQYFSDYYLEDASFARIENITVGYTIPSLNDLSARIYATATNVYTFTNYSGLDPEVGNGIEQSPFPRSLGFVFGISLGL
ncbi:MAG: SusC/RagA family TonB-linked outer membrane protein, partial [Bacteroidota bacterium]